MATALHSTMTRFFDKCGQPLIGGQVFTYEVGTTEPKPTYTDARKEAVNTNPVVLNNLGAAQIFLDGAYRVRILDRNGVLIEDIAFIESWIAESEVDVIYQAIEDAKQYADDAVTIESERALAAEETLQDNIDAETARATATELTLSQTINLETWNRQNADSALQGQIDALGGGSSFAYTTYALMTADSANIPANSIVSVTNDTTSSNNGEYQFDGTSFTKSAYDPLAIAKAYSDTLIENKASIFQTKSELDSALTTAEDQSYAQVVADEDEALNSFYQKIGGEWVVSWNPLAAVATVDAKLDNEIVDRRSLIKKDNRDGLFLSDQNGFTVQLLDLIDNFFKFSKGLHFQDWKIDSDDLKIVDQFGFAISILDVLTGGGSGNTRENVDVSQPLLSNKLAFWHDKQFKVYVPNLLKDREAQAQNQHVICAYSSQYSENFDVSDSVLTLAKTSEIVGINDFYLRDKQEFNTRSHQAVDTASVPNGTGTIKIHLLGDSITVGGGGALINRFLSDRGYTPQFIGTYNGQSVNYRGSTLSAQLGEARGGWSSLAFTNYATRNAVVPSGATGSDINVADYLALANSSKSTYSPYIRPTTVGDDAELIQNGYVFDFADYLAKFSLDAPDVVWIGLGTNDLRYTTDVEFESVYEQCMRIIIGQIRAWSSTVKIVMGQWSPVLNNGADDNEWAKYAQAIRIQQALATEFNCTLINTHLIHTGEVDHAFTASSTDVISGAESGYFSDSLHPQNATRFSMFDYVSANIVASHQDLI